MPRPRSRFCGGALFAFAAAVVTAPAAHAQGCQEVRWDRVAVIGGAYAVTEAALLVVRGGDWWPQDASGFRFAWDASPAKQQDRLLHVSLSHEIAHHGSRLWRWACFDRVTSAWLSAGLAVALQLPKEIGDGFQEGNGFDVPDFLAASAGATLSALHELRPSTRAIVVKFNYWPSDEFVHRAAGEPDLESDYAGQRVYLAFNPGVLDDSPMPDWWPRWLGVAVGHSVDHWIVEPPANEWYFAADLSLRSMPIRTPWWPAVAEILDHVHLPLPGIRVRRGSVSVGLF